jgi:hypothetical protein
MEKWEYNLLVQSPNTECAKCEAALNGLGEDGWELVTLYVNGAGHNVFVLKRLKGQKKTHLTDLKREHLIEQVLPPEVPEPDSLGG